MGWQRRAQSRDGGGRSDRRRPLAVEALETRRLLAVAPVAGDDLVAVSAGEAVVLDSLLLNDVDADGHALRITAVTQPAHGSLAALGGGHYRYTPAAGYAGLDSFSYTVTDGIDGSDVGQVRLSVNQMIDIAAARTQILAGVTTIHSGVQPGRMVAYGPEAFAVARYPGDVGEGPMIAAAGWGRGRVIAVPDHQMLNMASYGDTGTTGQLYRNGLAWLAGTTATTIRIVTPLQGTADWLRAQGYSQVTVSSNYATALANADVLVGWLGSNPSQASLDAIAGFVRGGGGLFLAEYGAGYSWWWGKAETDVPGSRLLREAGIGFPYGNRWDTGLIDATAVATGQVGATTVLEVLADSSGFSQAVIDEAAAVMNGMFAVLPAGDTLAAELRQAYDTRITGINPTPATPLTDSFDKALITQEMNLIKDLPAAEVTAHRTAEAVYGAIDPAAPRLTGHTVTIDTSKTGWLATGMYAAPGELVTLQFPASMVGRGYSVQLSGHVDTISGRSSWDRVPFGVARSFPIDAPTVQVAGAFGGAIYVNVGGTAGGTPPGLGDVPLTVTGAIQAPLFVLGETSDAAWIAGVRDNPAPYAEFVSDHLAFSVPSAWIRGLADPTALMTYWDEAVAFMDYVGGYESIRTGPERINVDVQISVGLLHAGFPIQGPTWASAGLVDLAQLRSSGNWGYFHELGHEMQRRPDKAWGWDNPFTFAGDVEVTVNIFANAALERMVPGTGTGGWGYSAHPAEVMDRAATTVNDASAASFEAKDPYPFYFQLADGFGWDSYRTVLSGYSNDRDTNPSALPQSAQEEKDQWLIRWSQATGRNLVGYMVDHWGLEASPAAIAAVNALGLPGWMPLVAQDDVGTYQGGRPVTIDVLANDLTLDGSARVVGVSAVTAGTLTNLGNGRFSFTPPAGFTGEASFTYTVANSAGVSDVRSVRFNPPAPRFHWTFDEGSGSLAADSAGNAHGTIVSGAWTSGQDGSALLFNGQSTKVTLGTGPSLSGKTDFTLSAWVKTTATAAGVIIQQRNGGFNGEYQFSVNANGTLGFMVYGNSAYQFSFSGSRAINDGAWHHVAAVRSGTQGLLYVDGQLVGSASGTVRDLAAGIGVGIGADIRDNNKFFKGALDEVAIYDVALSSTEIAQLAVPTVVTVATGQTLTDQATRSGSGQLVKRGGGTLILDRANTYSGGTVVEAGELVIRNLAALGSGALQILPGARVTLDVGSGQVPVAGLDVAATAWLDVGMGSILIDDGAYFDNSGIAAILARVARKLGHLPGVGPGIMSSSIQPDSFREIGAVVLPDGSLRVGYAAVGDANMDGRVNIQDLIALNAGGRYGTSATDAGWWQGDFNADGRVTITDLILLVAAGLYGGDSYRPDA